jgi:hypothetical protein
MCKGLSTFFLFCYFICIHAKQFYTSTACVGGFVNGWKHSCHKNSDFTKFALRGTIPDR